MIGIQFSSGVFTPPNEAEAIKGIVSNQNGADTLCRTIQIGTVNVQNTEK